MLTTIYLDGEMGKLFGKKWELVATSPSHALRMIDANKPGLLVWIKRNLQKYANYRVVVTYADGAREELTTEDFPLDRKMKSVRFVPLIAGAGAAARIVIGIVIVVVSCIFWNPAGIMAGAAMIVGGVIQLLSNKSKKDSSSTDDNKPSYYFNGSANTTEQGVPVQLIYGDKVLVGSHAISAALTVDQLI